MTTTEAINKLIDEMPGQDGPLGIRLDKQEKLARGLHKLAQEEGDELRNWLQAKNNREQKVRFLTIKHLQAGEGVGKAETMAKNEAAELYEQEINMEAEYKSKHIFRIGLQEYLKATQQTNSQLKAELR